jgi:hypothetical protein
MRPLRIGADRTDVVALRSMMASVHFASPADEALFAESLAVIENALLRFEADVPMQAELFGDIWGNASVEFMGVTLAAIHLAAFARFRVCGSLKKGMTQARGTIGFKVSVRILCVTYETNASLDITLIDGDCPFEFDSGMLALPRDIPAVIPVSVLH